MNSNEMENLGVFTESLKSDDLAYDYRRAAEEQHRIGRTLTKSEFEAFRKRERSHGKNAI